MLCPPSVSCRGFSGCPVVLILPQLRTVLPGFLVKYPEVTQAESDFPGTSALLLRMDNAVCNGRQRTVVPRVDPVKLLQFPSG